MTDSHPISETELDELIERVKQAVEQNLSLSNEDLSLLLNALLMLVQLQQKMGENDITLHKLRKLAGLVSASEKLKDVLPNAVKPARQRSKKPTPKTPSEPVVHQRCHHKIEGLEKGQRCPECERGSLYQYEPALMLRISGQTPLTRTEHILERLRCNTCGAYFTAVPPQSVKQDGQANQRYGYTARALMALHRYFAGLPCYRQQTLQQMLGLPVSASTVFDQCEHLANAIHPLFRCLLLLAAQAVHYHLDDTTNRILTQKPVDKPNRRTGKLQSRSGIYTSGVLATLAGGEICVLYQTNIGHAGEWLDEILAARLATAEKPIIMSDALSANRSYALKEYHLSLCNAHARREFVDLVNSFPDQVTWVLQRYDQIWEHERHCQESSLSPAQRLRYHEQHSLPVMTEIRVWAKQQLDTETVEENSALGKALRYFDKHFEGFTAFCRLEGAQLDNNVMEQALKLILRGRKNSLFFKTPAGAAIADVISSVIATAKQADINVFDYLVVLQRHADQVKQQPELWLPWNYQQALALVDQAA